MTPATDDAAIRTRGLAAIDHIEAERRRPIRAGINGHSYGAAVVPALTPNEQSYQIGNVHPPAIDTGWMTQAACTGTDQAIFFPDRGWGKARTAQAICHDCPVSNECLEYGAIDDINLSGGVWGGQTAAARRLEAKPQLPEIFR